MKALKIRESLCRLLLMCGVLFVLAGCREPIAEQKSAGPIVPAADARVFDVEGMTCEGCVQGLTAKLKDTPGVQAVKVSLEEKKAYVTADAGKLPDDQIVAAIQKAGYEAKPAGPKS